MKHKWASIFLINFGILINCLKSGLKKLQKSHCICGHNSLPIIAMRLYWTYGQNWVLNTNLQFLEKVYFIRILNNYWFIDTLLKMKQGYFWINFQYFN